MGTIKKWGIVIFVFCGIAISVGFQSKFFEIAKQIDIYTTMFKELNMYYVDEINPSKITKDAVNYMLGNLDPYTRYYDEQGVESSRIRSTGNYGGIGAISIFKDQTLTIREVLKNSPAEKAGMKPGDKILKVDDVLVKDFEDENISFLLNGLPDTKVNLQIARQNKLLEIQVTRKKININAVPFYSMIDNEVGYISFVQFNEKASRQVKEAFLDLKDQGMKKLIIDVRGNPGGLLNKAVEISNFFISKDKIIVSTKSKVEKWSSTFKTKNTPIDLEIPIVVLVNNRSASASEILAGSLQDYDRAVIVGERSFGKGLVQRFRELSYGTQMKITISKYYTPSGRCIQELDYTNRDDEGNIPKFSDFGRDAFKTEKGRIVYGGGGIMPDVEMEKPATTITTKTLLNSDAFFNYATAYFYKNKTIALPSEFSMNNSDYNDLIDYLKNRHNDFKTPSEIDFETAMQKAVEDNLSGSIDKKYNSLLTAIYDEKLKELDKNKVEILDRLTEEIVKRYYYIEGVYQQKTAHDALIQKSVHILNDLEGYKKLLN